MLEIRCSESGAVMQMRGMPNVCITATQTFDFVESFFDTLAKKLRHLSTISMARRVISVTRSAVGFVESWRGSHYESNGESIFMRRAHTPTIATDGRYPFSKLAFCFDAI